MIIQFNSDKNIKGSQELGVVVSEKINHALKHYADNITRIEVHISDQNAHKVSPDDVQCNIEARLEGMQPIFVSGKSDTKERALAEAIDKMKAALNTAMGKLKGK